MNSTNFKQFIKRPHKGMICKVHFPDRSHCFGTVVKVEKDTGLNCNRERLVLERTDKRFELNDCDYILEESRVRFVKRKKAKCK